MKSIKSILALFVAVLLMSTTTYAQRPSAPGADRGNRMVEMMTKELGLSDVQVEKIKVIQDEFTEKMRGMRGQANNANSDRTAMREEMQKAAEGREAAIMGVLSGEQREKWTTMKEKRGKRPDMVKRPEMGSGKRPAADGAGKRAPKGTGKRPEMRGKKLQKTLGLSDAQTKELKKLTKDNQTKIKELKASGKERKIKRVNKKYRAAVKKLLTPEQYEKWTSVKAQRKDIIH